MELGNEMYEVPGSRLRELSQGMKLSNMIKECVEDSIRWFPGEAQTPQNLALCLAGEVGEVANLLKKVVRGSTTMDEILPNLTEEVVDVLIYLCNLMGNPVFKDVDWERIWFDKREYNETRFNREPWFPVGDERV